MPSPSSTIPPTTDPAYFKWIAEHLYVPAICDALDDLGHRKQAMHHRLRPLDPENCIIVGRARTLRWMETDYVFEADPYGGEIEAIDSIRPGDVLVHSTDAGLVNAPWGELMSTIAKRNGAVGCVCDSLVRDCRKIMQIGFPVFATGIRPLDSKGRGRVMAYDVPIRCGDVLVHPGELIVADYDGIVVVPVVVQERAIQLAADKVFKESATRRELLKGRTLRDVYSEFGVLWRAIEVEQMKIIEVITYPITLEVRPEFMIVSSAGKHAVSRYVILELRTDEGKMGWGEATVVPNWSGETQGGALDVVHEYFKPLLIGRDPADIEQLIAAMDATMLENNFTKAAVEIALLDLIGQRQKIPLFDVLGSVRNPLRIPIKFSIGLREPEDAANIARAKVAEGFTALKMKVGPDPEKDLLRVRLVREAVGPNIKLNVDTNGGWTVDEAIREIPRYLPFNLEYVEQPVARWDIDGMAKVRAASPLPIMADESCFDLWQAEAILAKKAADLISIYPGKNGGVLKAQKIAKMAEQAGVACHIGSNLEWHIATAAMCHLAAACANVQVASFPVDILGPLYYDAKPRKQPIRFERGHVHVPSGNGLGICIAPDEIEALHG